MTEYFDGDWKVNPQLGRVHEYDGDWDAVHATAHGYVKMSADKYTHGAYTHLEFIWQGRLYRRTYNVFYGPRYAARLASRFAAEIALQAVSA